MLDLAWTRPKLAELCGVRYYDGEGHFKSWWRVGDGHTIDEHWNPTDDVAQAVRCASALGDWEISHSKRDPRWEGTFYEATVYPESADVGHSRGDNDSVSRAIVLAIVAAKGWVEP